MLRRGLAVAGAAALVVFVAATGRLFVWPSTDEVDQVDAVVVLTGGRDERLELAERLMAEGTAKVLVVSDGMHAGWRRGNATCTEARSYEVRCFRPVPDTTRGEARAIAAMAGEAGWTRLLVVTSTYHLSRAGLLLSRCLDGEVLTADARPDLGPIDWVLRIGHEWLGWTAAVTVQRDC